MARKMCNSCQTRPVSSDNMSDLCEACYEYGAWENQHNDDNHEGGENLTDECQVCHGTDPAEIPIKKGHSNGIAKSHTSHAQCSHPKTKADRAKCRKERAQKGE
jgi:hypothetical protein